MRSKLFFAIFFAIVLLITAPTLAGETPVLKTKALTSAQIMRITGEAALNVGCHLYGGDLYNGNRDVFITELSIYVKTVKNGEVFPQIYLCKLDIAPLSKVPFGINIVSGDENADYSWGIIKAAGYNVDPRLITSLQSNR
ncbi:MAG: hypothetical protein RBR20_08875 [Desulfobacterales bacterium]|jgi:hypothetical protein|nr:hypothetical protein [Desulfobacteraceae bacterium]MDD3991951.1 hypothetical protein [Desulfobacteraceae bacterium]MDY0312228.1 hypothetical protein [Desulfobacterales bacterium]